MLRAIMRFNHNHNPREEKAKQILDKLDSLKGKDVAKFCELVRKYFALQFNIRYKFTFEELLRELERRRIKKSLKRKAELFVKKIADIEYSQAKITQSEFLSLVGRFKRLALIINAQKRKEEKAQLAIVRSTSKLMVPLLLIKKLFLFLYLKAKLRLSHEAAKHKIEAEKRDHKEAVEEELKDGVKEELKEESQTSIQKAQKERLETLLADIRKNLAAGNTESLKKQYIAAAQLYNKLSDKEKAQHYEQLREVYEKLNKLIDKPSSV